jgi:hypothetical protein
MKEHHTADALQPRQLCSCSPFAGFNVDDIALQPPHDEQRISSLCDERSPKRQVLLNGRSHVHLSDCVANMFADLTSATQISAIDLATIS